MVAATEYALLSLRVYKKNSEDVRGAVPPGWEVLGSELPDDVTGFSAGAYRNTTTGEIVIAYTGTNGAVDWPFGNVPAAASIPSTSQVEKALKFYSDIAAQYGDNITFTGHSLGGGLASMMAVFFDKQATVFDPAPFQLSAINPVSVAGYFVSYTAYQALHLRGVDGDFALYTGSMGTLFWGRESNVVGYSVAHDVLQTLRDTGVPAIVGSETIYSMGATELNSSFSGQVKLHSMSLLTALMLSPALRDVLPRIQNSVDILMDETLYGTDRLYGTVKPEFMRFLVRNQAGVQGSSNPTGNGMIDRFAADLEKLTTGGMAGQWNVQHGLIAVAMEYYYSTDYEHQSGTPTEFFESVGNGLRFDLDRITSRIDPRGEMRLLDGLQDVVDSELLSRARSMGNTARVWTIQSQGTSALIVSSTGFVKDVMIGGAGADSLSGGDGDDLLIAGNSDVDLGAGDDVLNGGIGNDVLIGDAGTDVLDGGTGNDELYGGIGDDSLTGDVGNDTLTGGTGNDSYYFNAGDGIDTVVDSDGIGTLYYNGVALVIDKRIAENIWKTTSGLTIERHALAGTNPQAYELTIRNADNSSVIYVSSWHAGELNLTLNDTPIDADEITLPEPVTGVTIFGDQRPLEDANNNIIYDALGNIIPNGPEPDRDDYIFDTAGNDAIFAGGGNDDIFAHNGGDDLLDGGAGNDQLTAGGGNDHVIGGDGDDVLRGSGVTGQVDDGGNDVLEGNAGSDLLYAHGGNDVLYGGDQQTLASAISNGNVAESQATLGDSLQGMTGDDLIIGGSAIDLIGGGSGDDLIVASGGDDFIFGDQTVQAYATEWRSDLSYTVNTATGWTVDYSDVFTAGNYFDDGGTFGKDTIYAGTGDDLVIAGGGEDFVYGGTGNDILIGMGGSDTLLGEAGDDHLFGGGASTVQADAGDFIDGGAGKDWLFGDSGSDVLFGGTDDDILAGDSSDTDANPGDDYLNGEGGNDTLWGHAGADTLIGGEGDDKLSGDGISVAAGQQGNDLLDGGSGTDSLWGDGGSDTLMGGSGDDYLEGDSSTAPEAVQGDDYLDGGEGNDNLRGNGGSDTLLGGLGADQMRGDAGADTLFGGAGADYIEGDSSSTPEASHGNDYLNGEDDDDVMFGGSGSDTVLGGSGNDQLAGDASDLAETAHGNDYLDGGTGNDKLWGQAGSDTLIGGEGDDELSGDSPASTSAGQGDDYLDGGAGNDKLWGDGAADTLLGGAGNDYLQGDSSTTANEAQGDDYLDGGDGDDAMLGDGGADTLLGGAGNDQMDGDSASTAESIQGDDYLDGGDGNDILFGHGGADTLIGGVGNDQLVGDSASTSEAASGDDYLDGGDGDDLLWGQLGNDTLVGGDGIDQLDGGEGNDSLSGGDGDDLIVFGEGSDTLDGGHGSDFYSFKLPNWWHLFGTFATNPIVTITDHYTVDTPADGNSLGFDFNFAGSGMTLGLGSLTLSFTAYPGLVIHLEGFDPDDPYNTGIISNFVFNDRTLSYSDVLALGFDFQGTPGVDNLVGTGVNDRIVALASDDTLTGKGGDDLLDGGAGVDTMLGGAGNDTFIVDNAADAVTELVGEGTDLVQSSVSYTLTGQVENLTLTGGDAINGIGNELANIVTGNDASNTLAGLAGSDTLIGNGGSDRLDGGAGGDAMTGGLGDDVYVVDDVADTVNEAVDSGVDVVESSLTHALGTNVENLILTGTAAIEGVGNELGNVLTGNNANNTLSGGAGTDTLQGGLGNDTYVIAAGDLADVIVENAGEGIDTVQAAISYTLGGNVENLTLTGIDAINGMGNELANVIVGNIAGNILSGLVGNDTLIGNAGNDVLDGGSGIDTMTGGDGNDTYIVDNVADVVSESSATGGDNDRLEASVSYTLSSTARIETFVLTGTNAINATGNSFTTTYQGNDAANVIADTAGGNDAIYGNGGNDTLTGNNGANYFDGGTGADRMEGRGGSDTYVVDNIGDLVVEASNAGYDNVQASIGYTLTANVEALSLLGTADLSGTGNDLGNYLQGNIGANSLSGLGGNDSIEAGAGNDTIDGGLGNDYLLGGEGDDSVSGGDGGDYIVDHVGTNLLIGGAGNDGYEVGSGSSVVGSVSTIVEDVGGGTDTVYSAGTFVLSDNIENLVLNDAFDAVDQPVATDGTGNSSNNRITGTNLANVLSGLGGADTIDALSGNDTVYGGDGNDNLYGGNDSLVLRDEEVGGIPIELANADYIDGGAGDDDIFGGSGDDVLVGGDGNDVIYGGDDGGAFGGGEGGGSDFGILSNNDQLLGGFGDDELYGENGNDILDGGAGLDYMEGGDGDDIYYVDGTYMDVSDPYAVDDCGNPIVGATYREWTTDEIYEDYDEGYDIVYSAASVFADGEFEEVHLLGTDNLELHGNGSDQLLVGNAGNNYIENYGGSAVMVGAQGDDSYWVEGLDDTVVELAGEGTDLIYSLVDYSLATDVSNVENLTLVDAAIAAYGDDGDNVLTGNDLDNILGGAAGNDTLNGGAGNDALSGGAGDDVYRFGIGSGVDTVNDVDGLNTVRLVGNLTAADLTLTRAGADLILSINGTSDQMILAGWNNVAALSSGNVRLCECGCPVNLANQAPIAVLDTAAVIEDVTLSWSGNLLANDSDPDAGTSLSVTTTGTMVGAFGTLVINPDGAYSFTLNNAAVQSLAQGQVLSEAFAYTMTDNALTGALTANSALTVTVTGTNDAPVAVNDVNNVAEDSLLVVAGNVLTNDSDVDQGTTLTVANAGALTGTYGMVTIGLDGVYTYVLNGAAVQALRSGESVQDVFAYSASDGLVQALGSLTIAIAGANDAPVAVNDANVVSEDSVVSVTGNVLANDTDVDAGTVLAVDNSGDYVGTYGTLSLSANGGYTYALNNAATAVQSLALGEVVTDVFTYTAEDNDSSPLSSSATLTITVAGANDGPLAVADSATVTEDAVLSATGNVLSNDTDVDHGAALSVTTAGTYSGTYGTLVLGVDGQYSYTLNNEANVVQSLQAGQQVTDTFVYTASDGLAASSSSLVVTITGTNDAPIAQADIGAVNEDGVLVASGNVLTNDSDPDAGSILSVTGTGTFVGTYGSLVQAADGAYTYTLGNASTVVQELGQGELVTDVFAYTTSDNAVTPLSSTAALTITVAGVNDAPIVVTPIADQAGTEGQALSLNVPAGSFTDIDRNDSLTYTATLLDGSALPAWLSFDAATQTFSGTPAAGSAGSYQVRVIATDMFGAMAADVFSIVVSDAAQDDTLNFIVDGCWPDPSYSAGDICIGGKQRTYGHYDGGAGIDTLLGTNQADAILLEDELSPRPVGTAGARVKDIEIIDAGAGDDVVDMSSDIYTYGSVTLRGGSGNDVLIGNIGNDVLDGGIGDDCLAGGVGNDTYVVDSSADAITENANQGADSVQSSVSYTLSANVENLSLVGDLAINGTGNALANVITGNGANNILNGGTGADTLLGGSGDDTYVIDNIGDSVTENAGEGVDLVKASINYTLGSYAENLTLTGSSAISGTGNSLDNVLTGNSANNTLSGGDGNDTLNGGSGSDTMLGGLGNDTYVVAQTGDVVTENASEGTDLVQASIAYTLGNDVENLTLTGSSVINGTGNALDNVLTGNSANNTLAGGEGNDTIDGGAGTDTMSGGTGNDVYFVNVSGDVTTENANEGIDTVNSAVTRTLTANIELLFLTGTSAINGTGNALANLLRGNTANNNLAGGSGTDILEGGAGNDILSNSSGNTLLNGGAGTDTLTGTTNNDLLIGGVGNDALTTGAGADIIAFNKGDGQDTVAVSTTKDNTLSIGGGTTYADLLFQKSGNNLILKVGASDQITFTNYYASTSNRSVNKLQVVLEGSADYAPGGGDSLCDNKIETFDFGGLVAAFDTALVANPSLTSWSLSNALLSQYLSGSDTAAVGGDLAYQYGRFGNEANVSYTPALGILGSGSFGTAVETLQALASLQDSSPRLS